VNIIEALDDPNLLGASIRDAESWRQWRALLSAAFGLPLSFHSGADADDPLRAAAVLAICLGLDATLSAVRAA
jgi:hypothetical protein